MISISQFETIAELPNLDTQGLAKLWRKHLTDKMPAHLPKSLLTRLLAYRLQVEQHVGLSRAARSYLKVMEAELLAGREPETPLIDSRQLKPGSLLVREHEETMHRVMVLEEGFSWDGKTFASLSAVAKAITGTQWNGHRFFGLTQKGIGSGEAVI